jgi:hypothetical protein
MKYTILLRYPDEQLDPFDRCSRRHSRNYYVAYMTRQFASQAQADAQDEAFRRLAPADRKGRRVSDFAVICTIEGHVTLRTPGSAWISPP